jgi:hypothetical protein
LQKKKPVAEKEQSLLNSFEPAAIIESEEMARRIAMAQRDFLMKSFKITEQVAKRKVMQCSYY